MVKITSSNPDEGCINHSNALSYHVPVKVVTHGKAACAVHMTAAEAKLGPHAVPVTADSADQAATS